MPFQEPGPAHRPRIRRLGAVVALLTALLLAAPLVPPGRLFSPLGYLPLHTALEFAAMAVSVMVFALSWNLRHQPLNSHLVLLGAAFLSVGLIDFGHALTYPAMPGMLGDSGPQLTLDFWLSGRAIAALGLFAAAVLPVRSWPPAAAVAATIGAVALSALVWWLSLFHGDWLPRNVTPAGELTAFKIGTEYALSATYFLAALLMLRRRGDWAGANLHFLAAGAWVLGLGELLFTLYVQPGDVVNFAAHLYKTLAYIMLYRALFVAGVVAPHKALRQNKAELAHIAHHDALTGLPNRLLVETRLRALLAPARRAEGALLLLDLDAFKNVNESLGHAAGDELLRLVALRLAGVLPAGALLGRMGGDEFAVLADEVRDDAGATALAQAMIAALKGAFVLGGGQELHIGTSIGICRFPQDGDTVDQVIRNADAALYEAKAESHGAFRFYTRALTERVSHRVEMERRLRGGIARGEFALHYQPLVRASDGAVVGAEALLRWLPPGEPAAPAGSFIKVAEDTGLIVPLGEWGLREACRQMKAWRDAGLALDVMAVNLSPQQFKRPDVVETVAEALKAAGLDPAALELEITESGLMGAEIEATLRALKALGVQLAIDDFGTGYSSLAYLKRFPVDKVKIDRSFVHDIPDDAKGVEIAAAVVALGKALGLEVLAEGVETEGQLAHLRRLGCHTLQGYLLGKPMPAEEMASLLRGDTAALHRLQLFGAPAAAAGSAGEPALSVA
ncbi:MAG: EAL domain-containing protein [Xanthobacteraceae bacterium]|nr:EAL domain-containing protein [Xanthobacteraceae bacterium]